MMSSVSAETAAAGAAASSGTTTAAAASKKVARAAATAATLEEYSSLNKRMSVDKNVVDELLLVCGVIGTTVTEEDDDGEEQQHQSQQVNIVPVTDCLNWLQDLQRALRRDDDLYRPISCLLGDWKVVQQKLLPLVHSCRYDTPMVLTVCKILVILTKPLSENTQRAGRMVIDTKKTAPEVVKEQIKLRENALQQAETLMEYKRAFCHHPSHLTKHNDNINSKKKKKKSGQPANKEGGILSIFVSLLAEPLSKTGTARSDTDHLTIELVLHLFRNLLSAEPLLHTSAEGAYRATQLHNELVSLLERELVLEILLVLGADLEQRENQPYNLLVMELLHHLLRHQDPTAVARSSSLQKTNKTTAAGAAGGGGGGGGGGTTNSSFGGGSRLKQQLAREKQAMQPSASTTTRHSHFGGTLVLERQGRKQLISAARVGEKRLAVPLGAAKRTNKKSEPFIGSKRCNNSYNTNDMDCSAAAAGPAQVRAWRTLDTFCERFMKDCYGPVMKSLKNEFRRDSARLEDGDRATFFRIVWFFCQWWRMSGKKKQLQNTTSTTTSTATTSGQEDNTLTSANSLLGQLIFTMDIFTFKLVLDATDTFQTHKQYPRLAQSVALLSEMMHLLHVMTTSHDTTERLMGLGLMDRLFYGSDPLERLPKLLSGWEPGTSTREYLCDLVELCHMTLKLLEANAKAFDQMTNIDSKDNDAVKYDTIAKMKAAAADFDVTSYLSRKIISNHTVFMYTQLLSQYALNAPHTNHRIMALFLRLSKVKIASAEDDDITANESESLPRNLLATKTVTLEPMLYNIQLLIVLDQILNDQSIRNDKSYASLLTFASGLIQNFAKASRANSLLFVEALFKHPLPHRFCALTTNMYVSEELRMIAERELLLEEQKRLEEEAEAAAAQDKDYDDNADDDDDNDEDELEFDDFGITSATAPSLKRSEKSKKKRKRKKGKQKQAVRDSDDDDDESKTEKEPKSHPKHSLDNSSDDEKDGDDDDDDDAKDYYVRKKAPKKNAETPKPALRALEDSSDDESGDEVLFGAGATKKARFSTRNPIDSSPADD